MGFAWGGEVVLNLRDARAQLVDRGIRLPVVENDDVWLCVAQMSSDVSPEENLWTFHAQRIYFKVKYSYPSSLNYICVSVQIGYW